MCFEETFVLFQESVARVMLLLAPDIALYRGNLRMTHGECRIPYAPRKLTMARKTFMDPPRRVRFQRSNEIGERHFRAALAVVRPSLADGQPDPGADGH